MSCEEDLLLTELIGNCNHVGDKFWHGVPFCAVRLGAEVVATLIGNDNAKSCRCKRGNLGVPGIPKLRESMQQNYYPAIRRTAGDGMNLYVAIFKLRH
jgi:hypothetical protein